MKILGGHDYYDGAGWGVDETAVFVRSKEERFEGPHPFKLPKGLWRHNQDVALVPGLAIVGEHVIPFWEERRMDKGWQTDSYALAIGASPWRTTFAYHYTPDTPIAITKTLHTKRQQAQAENDINAHFSTSLNKTQLDWIIENQVATAVIRRLRSRNEKGLWVEINKPTLKDIELYKALDPATTHMAINSWISGVLPASKPLIELTDKDKIKKAGFNNRSFRKDPEKLR